MKKEQTRLEKPIVNHDGVFADHDTQRLNQTTKAKIGQCQGLHCQKKQAKLIGYCYFNTQIIDTKKETVRPSGEKAKLEYCLDCYLYNKPLIEEKMAREHQNNPSLIPYQ